MGLFLGAFVAWLRLMWDLGGGGNPASLTAQGCSQNQPDGARGPGHSLSALEGSADSSGHGCAAAESSSRTPGAFLLRSRLGLRRVAGLPYGGLSSPFCHLQKPQSGRCLAFRPFKD